jgi:hypothetical protein
VNRLPLVCNLECVLTVCVHKGTTIVSMFEKNKNGKAEIDGKLNLSHI